MRGAGAVLSAVVAFPRALVAGCVVAIVVTRTNLHARRNRSVCGNSRSGMNAGGWTVAPGLEVVEAN